MGSPSDFPHRLLSSILKSQALPYKGTAVSSHFAIFPFYTVLLPSLHQNCISKCFKTMSTKIAAIFGKRFQLPPGTSSPWTLQKRIRKAFISYVPKELLSALRPELYMRNWICITEKARVSYIWGCIPIISLNLYKQNLRIFPAVVVN